MTIPLNQYRDCGTAGVRSLDLQLIAEMIRLAPGVLSRFDHELIHCGSGTHNVLQTAAVKALHRAVNRRGTKMQINSAYRTVAQQFVLRNHFEHGRCGFKAVARVGSSNHNGALAIDIEDAQGWRKYLEAADWDWIGSFDPMHFDFEGGGTTDIRPLSVRAFQSLWNLNRPKDLLVVDGVFGDTTRSRLLLTPVNGFDLTHEATETTPTQQLNQTVDTIESGRDSFSAFGSIRQGARGDLVSQVQKALTEHGFKTAIDGIFGSSMAQSVRAFQESVGLVADGVVGKMTRERLGLK